MVGRSPGKCEPNYHFIAARNLLDRRREVAVLSIINIGARSLLIVNLRLRLTPEKGEGFYIYPSNAIPEEAIIDEASFSDYGRLTVGAPFRAKALASREKWDPYYRFGIQKDRRNDLVGPVAVQVDVKIGRAWQTV